MTAFCVGDGSVLCMNPAFFFGGYFLFRYFCSLIKNENYGK